VKKKYRKHYRKTNLRPKTKLNGCNKIKNKLLHIQKKGYGLWCLTPLSAMSWRSVLLVEETGVLGEKQPPDLSQVTDKLYHIMLYRVHL